MMIFTKVCGLRNIEEIDAAIKFGYSAIGIMLHSGSCRFSGIENALKLSSYAKGKILTVAVALTFNEVKDHINEFDMFQIYEYFPHEKLIYSGVEFPPGESYKYFLYDASRGSGESKEFPYFPLDLKKRLIISGGLNPENVCEFIKKVEPFGVDVCSGVEKIRGIKDIGEMKRFIGEVKNAF